MTVCYCVLLCATVCWLLASYLITCLYVWFPGRPRSNRSPWEKWPTWTSRLQREQRDPWLNGDTTFYTSHICNFALSKSNSCSGFLLVKAVYTQFSPGFCRSEGRRGPTWCCRTYCKSAFVKLLPIL